MSTKLLNQTIFFLISRMRVFRGELTEQASNPSGKIIEPDRKRITSYIDAIKGLKAHFAKASVLDFPKTNPRTFELGEGLEVPVLANQDMIIVLSKLKNIEDEMEKSQSSQMSSNFHPDDNLRFDSYIKDLEDFLVDFVDVNNPIDRPESVGMGVIQGLES